ncbi:Transcriptional regulatory protein moc3 [Pleurostoma richardsiae]|uniref:Transcriptional regulatory protein moc3 n=1 Tax=Pleurostoma richardsiae TaxID=41990 RepID=A0AA38RN66_9PEZI|nr:Transcriptional regulatory protein moc3 [Pleurostoma richardsiae]
MDSPSRGQQASPKQRALAVPDALEVFETLDHADQPEQHQKQHQQRDTSAQAQANQPQEAGDPSSQNDAVVANSSSSTTTTTTNRLATAALALDASLFAANPVTSSSATATSTSTRDPAATTTTIRTATTAVTSARRSQLQNGSDQRASLNDGVTPASPSPPMSHHPSPPPPPPPIAGPARQHAYPGAPYPSSTMPAQYAYPTPAAQTMDQYRTSTVSAPPQPQPPHPSNPLALPSMRSLDPLQQQQQQQVMPMPVPIPGSNPHGLPVPYYGMPPQPYGIDHPMARFALPPNIYDPRVQLSGGRHKKEIKRRTKTGCLTCRKRRIKCDETHPTCNNCKKSKRECLGYDPIFKQPQSQATIQPASSSQSATASAGAPISNLASSSTITYVQQPTLTPSTYSTSTPPPPLSFEPTLAAPPPTGSSERLEASAYIDPALDIAAAPSTTPATASVDARSGDALQLRAKKMKVDELIALGGLAPPTSASPPTREIIEEVTKIYYEIYVPGLCQFFESQWYNFKSQGSNPISTFLANKHVVSQFAEFLRILPNISSSDASQMAYSGNIETRLVWALTTLAYSTPDRTNHPSDDPVPEDDAIEVRNRLRVFDTLLSGGSLPTNPLMPPPKKADSNRKKEFEFWFSLGEYLRVQGAAEREDILSKLRALLDGRENRDVLYSLAILRELTPHFEPGYENKVPEHLDESEPRNKLYVASQFIMNEATTAGGTTNVVRRYASLATKSFINPGTNVTRRPR